MEIQWSSAIASNKTISNIKIKINYSGDNLRPSCFSVSWLENGVLKNSGIIAN
jgi:hypothetical protein